MVGTVAHSAPALLNGGCRCGAVRYQVHDCFLYALNCHCSRCRAGSGSAFRAIAAVAPEHFGLTQGADATFVHGDPAGIHDTHCSRCGSLLYSWIAEPDNIRIHLPLGTLADTPSIRPQMHIFVGSKAPWYEILDDLPQFDTLPGA